MTRREILQAYGASLLVSCSTPGWAGGRPQHASTRADAVTLTDAKWREILSSERYQILRQAGTERAFTGAYARSKDDGVYVCAGCGLPLFDSKAKFESGTGWPSFTQPFEEGVVADLTDSSHGMVRVETVCARCGGHLGHVFPDGPEPTGLRYCMNSASLVMVPRAQAPRPGDTVPVTLGAGLPGSAP